MDRHGCGPVLPSSARNRQGQAATDDNRSRQRIYNQVMVWQQGSMVPSLPQRQFVAEARGPVETDRRLAECQIEDQARLHEHVLRRVTSRPATAPQSPHKSRKLSLIHI